MGGGATFTYAKDYPSKVAAIVPIAAAEGGTNAARMAGIPVWAAHAFDDSTVSLANTTANIDGMYSAVMRETLMTRYPNQNANPSWSASTDMVATPLATGEWKWEPGSTPSDTSSKGMVTVYKGGGHDSWSRTLTNPSVWEWLFRQSR